MSHQGTIESVSQRWLLGEDPLMCGQLSVLHCLLYGCLVDTGDKVVHVRPRAEKLTSCTFQTAMDAPGPSSSSSIFPSPLFPPFLPLSLPFHRCFGLFKLGKAHNEREMHMMSGKIIPLLLFCGAVDTARVCSHFTPRFWTLERRKCVQEAPTESRL